MRRIGPIFWPILLIALGVLFLLSNLGWLPFNPWQLWRLWPVIFVVIGVDILLETSLGRGRAGGKSLSIDRDTLSEAQVSFEFGAGELNVAAGAGAGKLLEGEFTGDVEYQLRDGRLKVYAHPGGWGGWGGWGSRHARRWDARLAGDIPLTLRFQVGACHADLDLGDLKVTDLALEMGAAEARLVMPRAAGLTRARVKAGAASVKIGVPEGVAARITSAVAIGSFDVDTRRFPRSAAASGYESPDYATAANKIDLSVEGGVGSVTVS
jgi:hypothetical protein